MFLTFLYHLLISIFNKDSLGLQTFGSQHYFLVIKFIVTITVYLYKRIFFQFMRMITFHFKLNGLN